GIRAVRVARAGGCGLPARSAGSVAERSPDVDGALERRLDVKDRVAAVPGGPVEPESSTGFTTSSPARGQGVTLRVAQPWAGTLNWYRVCASALPTPTVIVDAAEALL